MMDKEAKIYVAGHRGMVGSAIVRRLEKEGYGNLVLKTSSQLDLRNQGQVEQFFSEEKPEYVFLAAAKVGGIVANSKHPADFMYDNMILEINVIHSAFVNQVKKLMFWAVPAFTPEWLPSRCRKAAFLPVPWNRPMKHMPWPRSQG